MSKYDALRTAFKGRSVRIITVLALVGAIAVPNAMSALSATGDQEVHLTGAPCAIFDTRFWDMDADGNADGPLAARNTAGDRANFLAAGSESTTTANWDFYDQSETTDTVEPHQGALQNATAGGNEDGCGVPDGADGIFLQLDVVNPQVNGNIQVGPSSAAVLGGVLVFEGGTFGNSSAPIVEIDPTSDSEGHVSVANNSDGTVHVRGSVIGYTCDSGGGGCAS